MEDAHIAHYDDNVSVFGVFDGHGGIFSLMQALSAHNLPPITSWDALPIM